ELLSLSEGVARLRLQGSCSDCSASSVTLELAIKQQLEELAPDLEGLEVEGVAPPVSGFALPMVQAGPAAAAPGGGSLALPMAGAPSAAGSPAPAAAWVTLDGVALLEMGRVQATQVAGNELLVANVDGTLLAYRDRCAGCGGRLAEG